MNVNALIRDWAWRVNDGMPDPKNRNHLQVLEAVLKAHKYPQEFIDGYLKNLTEAEVDSETPVKYKDENGERKEMAFATALKQSDGHPARIEAEKMKDEDPEDTAAASKSMYDNPEKGSDAAEKKAIEKKPKKDSKSDNLISDHETVDTQLGMTKAGAKAQAAQKGIKDVGAGTAESRAGEAMVHKGLRMYQGGSSLEEIEASFMEIANNPESVLNSKSGKEWVKSAIASIKMLDSQFGSDNIKTVSWDTSGGRKEIGVDESLETSSDMFVQLKDGKNIGVSLKKSGKVFLANGGWAKQSKLLADSLSKSMSEDDLIRFEKATSIEAYDQDIKNKAKDSISNMDMTDWQNKVSKLPSHPEFKKYFGGAQGPRYMEALKDLKALKTKFKDGKVSKIELKAFSKLLQTYQSTDSEAKKVYDDLRSADHNLTKRTFEALNESEDASNAMKLHIVKSMHIMDTLGLNTRLTDGGLDGFTTVYGIPPDGAVLNEESLVSLLGDKFKNTLSNVRSGELGRNELEKQIASQISMDYITGEIIFTHESGRAQPIFTLKGRAKAIGASPTMEMAQTTYMVYALKNGTFDVDQWDEKSKKAYDKLMAKDQ